MSFLTLVPEFLIHSLVVLGIGGVLCTLFLSFIPFIRKYSVAFILIFIVVLACGIYLEGGLSVEKDYKIKVAELEKKIAVLEQEEKNINSVVDTVYVDRIKYIEKKGETVIKHVPVYISNTDDSQCTLPESAIILYNESIKREYK